jgi:hypothetical protein
MPRRWQPPVAIARDRICRHARQLGWVVHRDELDGAVDLSLFCVKGPHPHIRVVRIVADDTPPDDLFRDEWVDSGLAIPRVVTPSQVTQFLDELSDIERSMA